jgi:hypothetical protein
MASFPISNDGVVDLVHHPAPSILTVERASAARIYLETHFNQLLGPGPSARKVREQQFEAEMFNFARERGVPLTMAEVAAARGKFYRRETEYLRALRVTRAKGLRALMRARDSHSSSSVETGRPGSCGRSTEDYETIRVLGKGSFGVVRLVRDRAAPSRVYAMKVIRKSKMLQSSQEGHLWAERDLLVASEGSRW